MSKKFYKYWEIVEEMPDGFAEDKTVGSSLAGHIFITNKKSVLNGQIRKLLKVKNKGKKCLTRS